MKEVKTINVAPSSTDGHFVRNAREVVMLDNINETFLVKGKSELVTSKHTTLKMDDDCVITCQVVFDPFKQAFQKSRD